MADKDANAGGRATDSDSVSGKSNREVNEKGGYDETDLAKHATQHSKSGSNGLQEVITRQDGSEYPSGPKLTLIVVSLCLAVFLMALDNSIIATAIPKITSEFNSLDDIGWYASAYLLTTSSPQLLFGKFYTYFNIKYVFLIAIGIFELGSLICGVAQNSLTLILGRAVAGLGSAGLFSGALLILAHSVPLSKRPIYTGMIGGMYGIASVAGPLLGGVFTDKVTWRWCFFINLPIGAVTIVGVAIFFQPPVLAKPKEESLFERIKHFDPLGTIIFLPAIICLLLALQWGGTTYAWNSGRIIALLVIFGVLLVAFCIIQWWVGDDATLPLRILRVRTVWATGMYAFCLGASFFIAVYYVPLWFQAVQGQSAVQSGIRNLPLLLSVVVLSIVAGACVTAFGYYTPWMFLGTIMGSVGSGLLSTWNISTPTKAWIGYQILAGLGPGAGMQQTMVAVQVALDIKDVPIGTSFVTFMQIVGGSIFVSVAQTVFSNRLVQALATNAPSVNPAQVLSTGAASLRTVFSGSDLTGVLVAYNDALTKTFIVAAALFAASIVGAVFTPWLSVKGKQIDAAVA